MRFYKTFPTHKVGFLIPIIFINMRYIITEEQYEFLNHGVKLRTEKMKSFGYAVQEIIDDNLDMILGESNKEGSDSVNDLFVYDIRLGHGNRVYDLVIRAVVDEKPEGKYRINDEIIKYIIMKLIRTKLGVKIGLDIELTTLE